LLGIIYTSIIIIDIGISFNYATKSRLLISFEFILKYSQTADPNMSPLQSYEKVKHAERVANIDAAMF
jgi:hypothetical protein